jgi:hypothetical protein
MNKKLALFQKLSAVNKQLSYHIFKARESGDVKTELRLLVHKTRNDVELMKHRREVMAVAKSSKWQRVDGNWYWRNPETGNVEQTTPPGGRQRGEAQSDHPLSSRDSAADARSEFKQALSEGRMDDAVDSLGSFVENMRRTGVISTDAARALTDEILRHKDNQFADFSLVDFLNEATGENRYMSNNVPDIGFPDAEGRDIFDSSFETIEAGRGADAYWQLLSLVNGYRNQGILSDEQREKLLSDLGPLQEGRFQDFDLRRWVDDLNENATTIRPGETTGRESEDRPEGEEVQSPWPPRLQEIPDIDEMVGGWEQALAGAKAAKENGDMDRAKSILVDWVKNQVAMSPEQKQANIDAIMRRDDPVADLSSSMINHRTNFEDIIRRARSEAERSEREVESDRLNDLIDAQEEKLLERFPIQENPEGLSEEEINVRNGGNTLPSGRDIPKTESIPTKEEARKILTEAQAKAKEAFDRGDTDEARLLLHEAMFLVGAGGFVDPARDATGVDGAEGFENYLESLESFLNKGLEINEKVLFRAEMRDLDNRLFDMEGSGEGETDAFIEKMSAVVAEGTRLYNDGKIDEAKKLRDDFIKQYAPYLTASAYNEFLNSEMNNPNDTTFFPGNFPGLMLSGMRRRTNVKNAYEDLKIPERYAKAIEDKDWDTARDILQKLFDDAPEMHDFHNDMIRADLEDLEYGEIDLDDFKKRLENYADMYERYRDGDRSGYVDLINEFAEFDWRDGVADMLSDYMNERARNEDIAEWRQDHINEIIGEIREGSDRYNPEEMMEDIDDAFDSYEQDRRDDDFIDDDSSDDPDAIEGTSGGDLTVKRLSPPPPVTQSLVEEMKSAASKIDRTGYKKYSNVRYNGNIAGKTDQEINDLLVENGWPATIEDVVQVTGALRENDIIDINRIDGNRIDILINPDLNEAPFSADLTLQRTGEGLAVYGGLVRVNPEHPDFHPDMMASGIFQTFVTAKKLNATAIHCYAAGESDGMTMKEKVQMIADHEGLSYEDAKLKYKINAFKTGNFNGFVTWAKYGFEYMFDNYQVSKLVSSMRNEEREGIEFSEDEIASVKNVRSVQELLLLPRGEEIWERYGFQMNGTRHAVLDFDPDSVSMRRLNAYLQRRMKSFYKDQQEEGGQTKTASMDVKKSKVRKSRGKSGEWYYPIIFLPEEDERILDEIGRELVADHENARKAILRGRLNKVKKGLEREIRIAQVMKNAKRELKSQVNKARVLLGLRRVAKGPWQTKDGRWWIRDKFGNKMPYKPPTRGATPDDPEEKRKKQEQAKAEAISKPPSEATTQAQRVAIEEKHIREIIKADAEEFVKNRDKYIPEEKRLWVTPYSPGEYGEKNATTYLSRDGKSGFAITDQGELISVFSGGKGRLKEMMDKAFALGARKLDCLGFWLAWQYAKAGWQVVDFADWDDQYAPDKWNYDRDGRPGVFYMVPAGSSVMKSLRELSDLKNRLWAIFKEYDERTVPAETRQALKEYAQFMLGDDFEDEPEGPEGGPQGTVQKSGKWQRKDGNWYWRNPDTGAVERTDPPSGRTATEENRQPAGAATEQPAQEELSITDPIELFRVKYSGLDHERCLVINHGGKISLEKEGGENEVAFSPEEIKNVSGAKVFIHNHPSGCSFSQEDIKFFIRLALREMIVFSVLDGKNVGYSLRVKSIDDVVSHAEEILLNYAYANRSVIEEWTQKIKDGEKTEEDANKYHHHEVMMRFADDCKRWLEYEKREYND